MPVRSLSSSMLRWPDRETVDRAVRRWAEEVARRKPEVVRIGYFGSYARGDWGERPRSCGGSPKKRSSAGATGEGVGSHGAPGASRSPRLY